MLLKAQAGHDAFITEKYADQIAAILAQWSAGLLQSPHNVAAIESSLAPDFSGVGLRAADSKLLRSGIIEVRRNKFSNDLLMRDAFLRELKTAMNAFSGLRTAELQITQIEPPDHQGNLKTRVRYEFVGSSEQFYRQHRVGYWHLEWKSTPSGEFKVAKWKVLDENQGRAVGPVFADITAESLGKDSSYSAQLRHGADYWRTVLDGACGIDIYGHNGVSVGDIDNDGFDDLYVCQPAGLPNRLYRNRGDGTFQDVTETAGVGILDNTACALFADIDNDGHQDLIIVRSDGPLLFINQGNGKFLQKPNAFKFANPPQGTFTGAALADYDRDGWLDIYFCLYIFYQGTDQYKYPVPYYAAENGPPNFMMRNNRDGTFRDVTAETGLNQNNTRYSFCCAWNDYNNDGWPDLYVVNDFGKKNLYRNNANGTFTDVAADVGVEDVGAGMSVSWFDYDNDGLEDLYVANMWTAAGERISTQNIFQQNAPDNVRALYRKHAMGNSLLRNGNGKCEEVTQSAHVGLGRWSWSSDAWDFDHDGYADLYVTNGMVSGPSRQDLNSFFWRQVVANSPNQPQPSQHYEQAWNAINELIRSDATWSGYERNVFYVNNRDGTFSDVSGAVGLDFLEDGRSFALADFDDDGRLEVFLKNRNAPQLRILKNVVGDLPPSIAVRLHGTKSNRDAIGAVITIDTEEGRQRRSLQAGSGFLSQHSKEMHFGLGEAKGPISATIRWPSGLVQEIKNLPANHRIFIEEGAEPSRMDAFATKQRTSAVSHAIPVIAQPELLPENAESWLLAPIAAPDFSLTDLAGRTQILSSFRGKPLLLTFSTVQSLACIEALKSLNRLRTQTLQVIAINVDDPANLQNFQLVAREQKFSFPVLRGSDDIAATYNIVYRYLFDRHRDLVLPTSFLIDGKGDIVKVYQGAIKSAQIEEDVDQIPQSNAERLARALPFPGLTETTDFRRNYLSFGSVYFQRGYYEQAGTSFQRALRDDPSSAEAAYGLGSVYLQQNKTSEARDWFERAIKLQAAYPDTLPNAWNNLGLIATREGHASQAILYFEKALELNPDYVIALDNLGNAYRQLREWEAARKILEHAVEVGPQDPEANYSLAMVYAQLDNTDRAYEYLQRALKARPDYPEALNNLAVLYLRTEKRDEAVETFEQCMRVASAFDQCYLNLARVYALEGRPDKERAVLLQLLKQHPDHPQAQSMLSEIGR
ncbi:MAG: VCBS repeat-containing protein [Acidobacteriaceae bacterium]|nr:VCBS repeat-containing protein [Acidobacteriaceae bacterium]